MRQDQPVEDSSTLAERERAEWCRAMDEHDGLFDDDDYVDPEAAIESIPDSTERLLLKNYYSMIGSGGTDPIADLLRPTDTYDNADDWSTLYKM